MTKHYVVIDTPNVPIKAWIEGVPFEETARQQVINVATLPFIYKHVAVMPDVHWGMGATVGSVIATQHAIIPAAVGVDIGCGMAAVQTSLTANDLPEDLRKIRSEIERVVPHGRTSGSYKKDRGSWDHIPDDVVVVWKNLEAEYQKIITKHPKIKTDNVVHHLGTLGTGNHFVEICLDENQQVWIMLHSGSRGVGNLIGQYFIELAKNEMRKHHISLPDVDLAYLQEGSTFFEDYIEALNWAQEYARLNRIIMMNHVLEVLRNNVRPFEVEKSAVNCHHNYTQKEKHFGREVWLTRKGAISAHKGELGIIPGSMGSKSFIVRGLGNPDSFASCSHGAGRKMSRNVAKKTFTLEDHIKATKDVECRKDKDVIDETPMAYKNLEAVMAAQSDLVEIVHTLKQVICVKG